MRTSAAVLLVLGLLAPLPGPAAGRADLSALLPHEIAGLRPRGSDRLFTRETLDRYLDGGAEACLAFCFRRLLVRTYADPAGQAVLTAEVYDMSVPADAFGFFSTDKDGEEAGIGREGIYGGGILRFWKGRYCIKVRAGEETGENRQAVLGLGARISAAIPDDEGRPALVACLPAEGLNARTVRYFHRQVSLDPVYYLADENALLLNERTEAALGQYPRERGEATLLVCRYPAPGEARRAYLKLSRNYFALRADPAGPEVVVEIEPGTFAGALRTGPLLILVLESPARRDCESLLRAAETATLKAFGSEGTAPRAVR